MLQKSKMLQTDPCKRAKDSAKAAAVWFLFTAVIGRVIQPGSSKTFAVILSIQICVLKYWTIRGFTDKVFFARPHSDCDLGFLKVNKLTIRAMKLALIVETACQPNFGEQFAQRGFLCLSVGCVVYFGMGKFACICSMSRMFGQHDVQEK